jgi:hypothetical protein
MKGNRLQFEKNYSRSSPKLISNVNMVVGTRLRLRSDESTHGGQIEAPLHIWACTHRSDRVPKELISRFVKICPTCQVRRGGSRLTPPNSRRCSPRLEMVARSPKLPSPPISRRESTFSGQMHLDRTPDYFGHLHGHNGWLDSHQNVQSRSALGNGVRAYQSSMGNLSHSIAGTLDPFCADLSIPPSQLNYTTGYVPTHGAPPQREF